MRGIFMLQPNELLSEAIALPVDIRAKLIEKLFLSINPINKEIDKLWGEEAEKRVDEIKTGKVKPIAGKKVFKKIQDRLYK
jgi:putative addiction module component (TIGR02574 family)